MSALCLLSKWIMAHEEITTAKYTIHMNDVLNTIFNNVFLLNALEHSWSNPMNRYIVHPSFPLPLKLERPLHIQRSNSPQSVTLFFFSFFSANKLN